MTTPQKLDPERVTKPIQLLAAWLVGLILVNGAFLVAAGRMAPASWERGALVMAAIANVPIFLVALFLLQTRFRPELQEDSYYSQYLDKRTNKVVSVGRDELVEKELSAIRTELRVLATSAQRSVDADARQERLTGAPRTWKIGLNKHLADFRELRMLLKERHIPLNDVFGAQEPPGSRFVAVAEYLDTDGKIWALRLALDLKMEGYTYFDPLEEGGIEEDILYGAYGEATYRIEPSLRTLLEAEPEQADLGLYEQAHRIVKAGASCG